MQEHNQVKIEAGMKFTHYYDNWMREVKVLAVRDRGNYEMADVFHQTSQEWATNFTCCTEQLFVLPQERDRLLKAIDQQIDTANHYRDRIKHLPSPEEIEEEELCTA